MAVYSPILGVTIKIAVGHQYGTIETSGQATDIKVIFFFSYTAMLLSVPGVLAFLISVGLLFRCSYVCLVGFQATCVYIFVQNS